MVGDNNQRVVGHIWWSVHLEVAVNDPHIGRTFRIQFTQSLDGILKLSGGGGFKENERGRFDMAATTASKWAESELGYRVADKEEWSMTKNLRGMSFQDREELSKLTDEERRELAHRLRSGKIELSEENESDPNA